MCSTYTSICRRRKTANVFVSTKWRYLWFLQNWSPAPRHVLEALRSVLVRASSYVNLSASVVLRVGPQDQQLHFTSELDRNADFRPDLRTMKPETLDMGLRGRAVHDVVRQENKARWCWTL